MLCPECHIELQRVGKFWICPEHGQVEVKEPFVPTSTLLIRQTVFISYGRSDASAFAKRLAKDLKQIGTQVWLDTEIIKEGAVYDSKIESGICNAEIFLAVMSKRAMEENSVCRDEVAYAFNENKQIIPILLDPDPELKPSLLLARRNWIDFSKDYSHGFQALLRYMNGDESALEEAVLPTVTGFIPLDFGVEIARFSKNFVGRQWLTDKIDEWLENDNRTAFIIVAEPGFGKSAFAAWFSKKRHEDVLGIHFCSKTTNERTLNPYDFVASLVAQLHVQLPGYAKILKSRFPEKRRNTATVAFRELIIEPLSQLPEPSEPRMIIIDSLDEAFLQKGESIIDILEKQIRSLPSWMRLVATTRPDHHILNKFDDMYLYKPSNEFKGNHEDISDYIHQRFNSPPLQKIIEKKPTSLTNKIETLAKGNFLYAAKVIDALETGMFTVSDIGKLTPHLSVFYNEIFGKLFENKEEYRDFFVPLFQVLIAAREPLSIELMKQACNKTADQVLRLRPFLQSFGDQGHPTYTLYHKSLTDWLTNEKKAGAYYIKENDGHQILADFGMVEFKNDFQRMSSYSKGHLSMHLAGCDRWQDLAMLVKDGRMALLDRWTLKGNSHEGLICLNGIIEHLRKQNIDLDFAAGLSTQAARIYGPLGKYSESEKQIKRALEISSGFDGRRVPAVAYHELGSLYLYKGDKNAAEKYYQKALNLCTVKKPVYEDEAAANLIGIATIKLQQHKYDDAFHLATDALQKAMNTGDSPHAIAANRILASVCHVNLEYEKAKEHLKNALLIAKIENLPMEKIAILQTQAWIQYVQAIFKKESLENAVKTFEKSAMESKKIGYVAYLYAAMLSMVRCALFKNDLGMAKKIIHDLEISISSDLPYALKIELSLCRAAIDHKQGFIEPAMDKYKTTLKLSQKYEHRSRKADALQGLGSIYRLMEIHDKAELTWEKAKKISALCSPERHKLIKFGIELSRIDPLSTPL